MFVLFCAGFDVTLFSEWTGVTERERESVCVCMRHCVHSYAWTLERG